MRDHSKMNDTDLLPAELGLREQNKLEKRQRIREAARELFSKRGYDSATLRQIARRAHVGLGTLFNYAQDKRDLVFLIFNEELAAVTDEALRAAESHHSLLDQLMDIYKPHYEYFSKHPALSRILLKELTFYSEGKQAAAFQEIRGRLIAGIEKAVGTAQQQRRIASKEKAAIVARQIFFISSGAIRWWIASLSPDPEEGLAELKRLLELQLQGLQPALKSRNNRWESASNSRKNSAGKARPRIRMAAS
ncbi:MAG TPA: helix-turn-helix domain-containing protein [Terriglobales bacterium]|nr:helix-turn-helix domain-containing protein [Terriglobales bacterium]